MNSKRIIQLLVVLVALGLIVFAYVQLSRPQGTEGRILDTIPDGASLVVEVDGFAGAGAEIEFLKTLAAGSEQGTCFHAWLKSLAQLDSLRAAHRNWFDLLEKSSFAFQTSDIYNSGNWSLAISLPSSIPPSDLMKNWLPDLPKREFKGFGMYVGTSMNWCVLNNCLVLAPTTAVLEDIIIQCNSNRVLARQEVFMQSYELRSKDIPLHLLARINDHIWLPLDPVFTKQGTSLIGYLAGNPGVALPLHLDATPGEWSVASALPQKTIFLDALHASEADSAWYALNRYYAESDAAAFWSKAWQDLGDSCQCDLNEAMLSWRTGEIGCAVIELGDSLSEAVSYIGISDTLNAIEFIRPLLAVQASPPDGIYTLAYPLAFQRNLPASTTVEPHFVLQHKGYLFAAATPGPLKVIRNADHALADDDQFRASLSQSAESSGRFVFQTKPEIALLPPALMALLRGAAFWCINTEATASDRLLVNIGLPIHIKSAPEVQAPARIDTPTEKETETETIEFTGRSWQVVNHNTQEKETLRHDGKDKLELLGADGTALWSIDVPGPILGEVVQIDALKNNKLQLAFATESAIYIIDRNGHSLPGFPFYPKPSITSPLLVADYDNSKKYRLIFSAGDGMLFNLGVDGKATAGWKYRTTGGDKIIQVKTAKIGGDDVLITATQTGTLQLLKRTGEVKATSNTILDGFDGKTLDIIAGNDFNSTNIVYSSGSGVKNVQLSAQ